MKTLISLLILISLYGFSYSQNDKKAKEILDKVSKEVQSYKTITADFNFKMVNQQEDISEEYDGTIKIKDNKYHLSLMGTETYCNGNTIWTHMVESEEVNITTRDTADNSFLNNPSSIFTMYKTGYKYSYKGEVKTDETTLTKIELYPEELAQGLQPDNDSDDSDLSMVVLLIDLRTNQIKEIAYYSKNGNIYTVSFSKFKTNMDIPNSEFSFDKTKFPDVEVIDLRD